MLEIYEFKSQRISDVFPLLLTRGVNPNLQNKYYKDTPLHCAIRSTRIDMVKQLLACEKIDLTIENGKGETPLQLAIAREAEAEHKDVPGRIRKAIEEKLGIASQDEPDEPEEKSDVLLNQTQTPENPPEHPINEGHGPRSGEEHKTQDPITPDKTSPSDTPVNPVPRTPAPPSEKKPPQENTYASLKNGAGAIVALGTFVFVIYLLIPGEENTATPEDDHTVLPEDIETSTPEDEQMETTQETEPYDMD